VEKAADGERIALWATRGEKTVAAVLSADGRVQMDLAGLCGIECLGELDRIRRALEERGVAMRQGRQVLHGRREGGALIRAALANGMGGVRPAQALLGLKGGSERIARRCPEDRSLSAGARARAWLWMQEAQKVGGGS
jgi:hypothetical protein